MGIYATNGYYGYVADQKTTRGSRAVNSGSRKQYLLLTLVCLAVSLILFFEIRPLLVALALSSFLTWVAYSHPKGAKGRPFWGTSAHCLGQVQQFHLGVMAFTQASLDSVLISGFFGLLFSSGHLAHEVKDCSYDRMSSIRTNAVVLGPRRLVVVYKVLLLLIPPLLAGATFAFGCFAAEAVLAVLRGHGRPRGVQRDSEGGRPDRRREVSTRVPQP